MTKLADLKQRLLENPEVREEYYARADAEFSLIEAMIIARLEAGRVSPSIATLRRYAEATGH